MTVEYKREMNRNYMVIKPDHFGSGKYAEKMLTENQISGLLGFHEKRMDDQAWFYYDITSRQPLSRILEVRALAGKEIRAMLSDMLFTLKQLERFLLDEGQLELKPEYIYVEPESFRCSLCLIPGRYSNFSEQFCDFAKYLLDHVCHTDTEAVVLAFGIFQESRKENFGIENLEQLMRRASAEADAAKQNAEMQNMEIQNPAMQNPAMRNPEGRELWDKEFPFQPQGRTAAKQGSEIRQERPRTEGNKTKGQEESDRDKEQKIKKIFIVSLVFIMIILPVGLTLLQGLSAIIRYKWILAGVEVCAAFLIMAAKEFERDSENGRWPEQNPGSRPPNVHHNTSESLMNKTEDWETVLRQEERMPEMEEDDLQTVLLTALPEKKDCRRLVPVTGGEEILVSYFPFIIGKNRDLVDFCIEDPAVSRLHARIDKKEDAYIITDLNSKNGTRVEGKILESNESCGLKAGEIIEIAENAFRFL